MAARRVHSFEPLLQSPSPGLLSASSLVTSTVKVAAFATVAASENSDVSPDDVAVATILSPPSTPLAVAVPRLTVSSTPGELV